MGLQLAGDSANQAWGVMDVLAVTDFPDIRFKSVIRSASEGNIIIIPREGGYLARFYIEIDKLSEHERAADRKITSQALVAAANRILAPYTLDVREISWWSIYDIGQRLTPHFDDVPTDERSTRTPRVFIAGDACHTHSPKAGQGMNVSMADAFNLGWKLAAVIRGQSPATLLHSYSTERHQVAADLIEFDRQWAARFSERADADNNGSEHESSAADNRAALDSTQFQNYFSEHGRYTAGMTVQYRPSELISAKAHQQLASGLSIGMRFHSAAVIRLADAKPMQLAHTIKADGRWRIFAFANEQYPGNADSTIWQLCDYLATTAGSPIRAYQEHHADPDQLIDIRVVFQQSHRELDINQMHPLLLPQKGRLGLQDTEKMFCPSLKAGEHIYDLRGISREGCVIIVRPDQYISCILPLDAHGDIAAFFAPLLLPPDSSTTKDRS